MKSISSKEKRRIFIENVLGIRKLQKRYEDRHYIIGIDPSLTNTALAVADINNKKFYKPFSASDCVHRSNRRYKHTVYERLHIIDEYIETILKKYPSLLVVIEGYSFSSIRNRELMGEVVGSIKRIFWNNPDYVGGVMVVSPLQLKKYIIGSSRDKLTKDKILMNVFKKMKIEARTNDEADAAVLMKIGVDLINIVNKIHKIMPRDEKGIRDFIKNGEKTVKLNKYEWEVLVSLVMNRCGRLLYDYYNHER